MEPDWLENIHCADRKAVTNWIGSDTISSWEFCLDADKDDCDIARTKGLCIRDEQEYAQLCQDATEVEQLPLF